MRIALLAIALGACMPAPLFPAPLTAATAVEYGSGPALVAYLAQRDARPAICDLAGAPPHLAQLTPELRDALVGGLASGAIAPAMWQACAKNLVASAPAPAAADFYDAALTTYQQLVGKRDLDTNPAEVERASAIQRFYLGRSAGFDGHANVVHAVFGWLRDHLAKQKLGHVATALGRELLDTEDIIHDRWQGRPIDAALLDELAATGNETTLRRIAARAAATDLRTEARRRIIRIHIALSPFDEVRAAGPALETQILETGHNAVSLAAHPVVRAWFDGAAAAVSQRDVVVRQDVWRGRAELLGASSDPPAVSVLSDLPLHGALHFELRGISQPVTVCASEKALDPSPCVAAADLAVQTPFATIDPHGAITFHDELAMSDVLPLAALERFAVPIAAGGKPIATLAWPLSFERPENLLFQSPEGNGPDLAVRVSQLGAGRAMFDVNALGRDYQAIVEARDLPGYGIASIGADGDHGANGMNGTDGTTGSECQNGGPGGNGGTGGPGGNGGDGGDVAVSFACTADCGDFPQLTQGLGIIYSRGGDGGAGGNGGRGGRGGAGGSSRSETTHTDANGNTIVDDPGCSAGSPGTDGLNGGGGAPGSPGRAGTVTF